MKSGASSARAKRALINHHIDHCLTHAGEGEGSAAMMLEHLGEQEAAAAAILKAIEEVLATPAGRTGDLKGLADIDGKRVLDAFAGMTGAAVHLPQPAEVTVGDTVHSFEGRPISIPRSPSEPGMQAEHRRNT